MKKLILGLVSSFLLGTSLLLGQTGSGTNSIIPGSSSSELLAPPVPVASLPQSDVPVTKTFHLTDKVLHQLDGLTRNPKSYMESSGVVFDRDSSIRWERRSHRLVVTANPGELDLIEALLHEAAATYVDPRKWSDAGHARSRDKLVGRYLWKYGYGSMWLEFARNGTYRMGVHGHMDPEETITKGTWKLRNGWITLHRSDHKKLPSPYCYTYPDGTGWALAIPQPMEEKDTKPKFRGFARRERGPAVSNEGAAIKAVSE